jgi:hypothetical protein
MPDVVLISRLQFAVTIMFLDVVCGEFFPQSINSYAALEGSGQNKLYRF